MPSSIITPEDLQTFKRELLDDIRKILTEQRSTIDRKWLKSHDVRKLLSLSPGTLQHLRAKGVIPFTKVGGVMYYNSDDIRKVLEGNQHNKN